MLETINQQVMWWDGFGEDRAARTVVGECWRGSIRRYCGWIVLEVLERIEQQGLWLESVG